MLSSPLSDEELDFLDDVLLDYGNDESVFNVSGLDGFLTAIVSGPQVVVPSKWLPVLLGGAGREPVWNDTSQAQLFFELVIRHMNDIANTLTYSPQDFVAVFNFNPQLEEEILIAEEWCHGYMRGVDLGMWPELEGRAKLSLEAITLHGRQYNFEKLVAMTLQEHQDSVRDIEPAARFLHAHWLAQRSQAPAHEERTRIGRNDPCPCGSGKKFKRCCLH